MTTRIDFKVGPWDCWRNMFGEWGAILSRKGEKPVIITRCATKEELIQKSNSAVSINSPDLRNGPGLSEFRHTIR
jgi:hypothetical protein